jgi:hypothetical protein
MQQFRGIESVRMIKRAMPSKRPFMNEEIAAAELAIKAQVLAFEPEILAEMTDGDRTMQEIASTVDLTEAPEDAVCSLVIDLMQYCEREKIDWAEDVMSRARENLGSDGDYEGRKR